MGGYKLYVPNVAEWRNVYDNVELSPLPSYKVYHNVLVESLKRYTEERVNSIYLGGVCYEDGTFITGHQRHPKVPKFNFSVFDSYKPEAGEIVDLSGTYIYGGVIISQFGHLITDTMVRLWYITKHITPTDKLIFCKREPNVSPLFWDMMDTLGIEKDRIVIADKGVFRIETLIVPEQNSILYGSSSPDFCSIHELIGANAIAKADPQKQYNPRIYLSRAKLAKKDCFNEEYFERFYAKRGYQIVYPETLPFDEQLRVIGNADEIVSTPGTLTLLPMFSPKKPKLTLLIRANEVASINQSMLFKIKGITDFTYIDVSYNIMPTTHACGVFLLGPTKYWKNYLDENNIEYDDSELEMDWSTVYEYLMEYVRIYSQNTYAYKRIKNMDFLDVINHMSMVLYEKPVNRKNMDTKSKGELTKEIQLCQNKIADLNNTITQLKSTEAQKNELLRLFIDYSADDVFDFAQKVNFVPDCLKVIKPGKKAPKALTLGYDEELLTDGFQTDYSKYSAKLTKQYPGINKQWKMLLGIPYAHICAGKFDLLLYNSNLTMAQDELSRLSNSNIDVVLNQLVHTQTTVKQTFTEHLSAELLTIVLNCVQQRCPDIEESLQKLMEQHCYYCSEQFIAKWEWFDGFAKWLLPLLNEIAANITSKEIALLPEITDMLLTLFLIYKQDSTVVGIFS